MRRSIVGSVAALAFATVCTAVATAQPYPSSTETATTPPPTAEVAVPIDAPDRGTWPSDPQAENEYIPDGDYDPDIDGYTVEREVVYDNTVAEQYDDGYDPNAYVQFQDALAPYGEWVQDVTYGYIWSPSVAIVGVDFFPYATGGHWVLSDFGWTWVSDWDWGWAPFHYGRWVTVVGRGWCWVPGTHWGPAWVAWRSGGGYVGYAPLPPRGNRIPPPVGPRGPWRFVVASNLGAKRLAFLPSHIVPSVFSRTQVVSNSRAINIGSGTVRVNFGPTGIMPAGAGVGMSTPVTLRTYAPAVMPRATIAPRPGLSLAQRPWAAYGGARVATSRPNGLGAYPSRSVPIGTRPYSPPPSDARPLPSYGAPTYSRPTYAPPAYSAPAPIHRAPAYTPPAYSAPAPIHTVRPSYVPPAYVAPAPVRPAPPPRPSYVAPARPVFTPPPSYSRPVYSPPSFSRPAPSFSAPSISRPAPPPPSMPSRAAPAFIRR
jgi:hypothetical protein